MHEQRETHRKKGWKRSKQKASACSSKVRGKGQAMVYISIQEIPWVKAVHSNTKGPGRNPQQHQTYKEKLYPRIRLGITFIYTFICCTLYVAGQVWGHIFWGCHVTSNTDKNTNSVSLSRERETLELYQGCQDSEALWISWQYELRESSQMTF